MAPSEARLADVTAATLDPLTLGLTLALLGMGGTLLTLYALSLIASLLKRLFPIAPAAPADPQGGTPSAPPGTAS